MRLLAIGAALLLVAGCSTASEREGSRMAKAAADSQARVSTCWQGVEASEQYQPVKGKLPPADGSGPSMALLTNQAIPSPAERAALLALYDGPVAACRRVTLDSATSVHPAYGVIVARAHADADSDYAQLVQGQMTWGDFASRSHRRYTATQAAMTDADAVQRQQLATAHAYEIQQRQALASAMSQWRYQQQVIAAINRPVSTQCTRLGTSLNCTSQ